MTFKRSKESFLMNFGRREIDPIIFFVPRLDINIDEHWYRMNYVYILYEGALMPLRYCYLIAFNVTGSDTASPVIVS